MLRKLNWDINQELVMSKDEILELARNFMNNKKVNFVFPGDIGEANRDEIEVIFLNPMVLEPDTIVCPLDIRVWVNVKTKGVTWADQM